jgi:hypothetical protein
MSVSQFDLPSHPPTIQLTGKVRVPYEAKNLMEALKDAESGRAQTMKGENLDVFIEIPDDLELREGVSGLVVATVHNSN